MNYLVYIYSLIFFTSISSFAAEYTSEVVCNIYKNQTAVKTMHHKLWHEEQDTWKFEINLEEDIYHAAFKLDGRNAYVEFKNSSLNLTTTKLEDFSIGAYPPVIGVNINDDWLVCRAVNETDSQEWKLLLASQLDLPIKIFTSKLDSVIELSELLPKNDQEEKEFNQALCYFIGKMDEDNRDLFHFTTSTFGTSREEQFPNVMSSYNEKILDPTFALTTFCFNQIDKREVNRLAKEISKALINFGNFIHAQSLKTKKIKEL